MKKRPLSVTAIAWVFIAAGVLGLAFHAGEFKAIRAFPYDTVLVSLVRAVAIICGLYLLRGRNWARWLAVAWLAYHVGLGAFHSLQQFAVHGLLLAAIGYCLWSPGAREYFRVARR